MKNELLLIAGASGRIFLAEAVSGVTRNVPSTSSTTSGPSFSPDGTLCAVAQNGSPYLRVFNTATGALETLTGGGPPNAATSTCFSPDGALLAVAHTSSPYVTVYDTSDWSKVTLTGGNPPNTGAGCHFSPNGSWLAVVAVSNPTITVYDISDWSKETISGSSISTGYSCRFSPDSAWLAVGHFVAPYLTIFDTSDWSTEAITGAVSGYPYHVRFEPLGEVAYAGHSNGTVQAFRVSDWTAIDNPLEGLFRWPLASISVVPYFEFSELPVRYIRGTVLDENGDEADRTVNVYRRSDSKLVGSTVSDATTGEYELEVVDGDVEYDVQFVAASGDPLNDLFYARVQSGDT